MSKLFGTSGIRGLANQYPMTAETALRVAMATALYVPRSNHRPLVLIGKDTRLSGYMIEPALTAGFVSMGLDVILSGPISTPGIAMLTPSMRADLGVMVSASHNPYHDNGIKLYGADGYKLSDEIETKIEARCRQPFDSALVQAFELGRVRRLDDCGARYIEHLKGIYPKGRRLEGLKVVVDCANGAAYKIAPTVLWELGAEVIAISVNPDGTNINQNCGAVYPENLQKQVVAHRAHLGLALDGDGDRVIMVDEKGQVVDGDQIMAFIAYHWHKMGRLKGNGIVTNVLSNLGLERFLEKLGLHMDRVPVGEIHITDHMHARGYNLGGEQNGHIVLSDYGTIGDGLITALQVLALMQEQHKPASQLLQMFKPLPQKFANVRLEKEVPLDHQLVKTAIQYGTQKLGSTGRLLVRRSGTEPVIRVMAEGDQMTAVDDVVQNVVVALQKAMTG